MRRKLYHSVRFSNRLCRAYFTERQYPEAVAALSRVTRPDYTHYALLAAALAQLGDKTAAAAHTQEVLRQEPRFSIQRFLSTLHYKLDSDRDHLRESLLKAGLSE